MSKRISTSKERIAEMMDLLDLKQSDIVKKTGIPKSSLSNYLSGKRTPNQSQLSVISDPYGINPAWLMGYDVPMELSIDTAPSTTAEPLYTIPLTKEEYNFIVEVRAKNDASFYKRMEAYMDLFGKGENDHANS